jgi:hypothetical protein
MVISDEDLVRQLEAVPLVEPPEMKTSILARMKAPHTALRATLSRGERDSGLAPLPAGEGGPQRRVRGVLIGLAWAAAIVIVVAVVLERQSLPWQHASATIVPVDQWRIVARVQVPKEGKLVIRRSGDQFAIQPSAFTSEPISVAWDQKKLEMADVVSDPEVVILQRKSGASGSAVIQLNVGGREVLRTAVSLD